MVENVSAQTHHRRGPLRCLSFIHDVTRDWPRLQFEDMYIIRRFRKPSALIDNPCFQGVCQGGNPQRGKERNDLLQQPLLNPVALHLSERWFTLDRLKCFLHMTSFDQ